MKKHARSKSSTIHLESHRPGCMWGILHILNYHQWHYVKKRLPYRRHGHGRNSTSIEKSGIGNHSQIPDWSQEHDNDLGQNSAVNEKKTWSVSMSKGSVRARLKALVAEEKSRRKGQHQRNSTSPADLELAPVHPSHQFKSCEEDSDEEDSDDQILLNNGRSPRTLHLQESGSFAASSDKPSTSKGFEDQSAVFLDALGLVNINEELLQKILHDRRNFLPQRFHSQKHFSPKIGLRRSGTFPARSSLGAHRSSKLKNGEESTGISKATDLDSDRDHEDRDGNSDVTFTPVPLPQLKDRGRNPAAISRFRDIKHKIKHVMRTNRKEKQRIVMDGVLDKIPNDQRVSKEKKEELVKKWREFVINKDYRRSPQSEDNYEHRRRRFKRTSSLDNSMDKYCQLYEASFNREVKHRISDRLKVREKEEAGLQAERGKRLLERILSLPDLKSYSFKSEDSASDAVSLEAQNRADITDAFSRGNSFDSANCPDSKNQLQLEAHLECDQTEEKSAENTESAAAKKSDLADVSLPCTQLELQRNIYHKPETSVGAVELSLASASNVNSQEIIPSYEALLVLKDSELDPRRLEFGALDSSPIKHQQEPSIDSSMWPEDKINLADTGLLQEGESHDDFNEFQVDIKDVELFNYVRDVLEVSGLSGPEATEAWNSANQPVSPWVYEEVEECLHMDPECSGNEESGECDHLLLFDLINEVLVNMHQQSLSYWPVPLSRHCHIHRMPVGQHLLKEVWASASNYLSFRPELDPTLDYVVSRDLEERSGWMDLQFESECIGIELEELIFDDLLEEIM